MSKKRASFWKGRSVLVTGGSGFIGFALSRRLRKLGAKVTILDIKQLPVYATKDERAALRYVKGSVISQKTVAQTLKKHRIQTIFHLAAEAIVGRAHAGPAEALDTNVRGTWALLECARTTDIEEIIVASSDKAYGTHAKLPYLEHGPLAGENPYDVSKSAADLISNMYAKTFDMPIAIARCGNVYGPGDLNWSRLIPDALRSIIKNHTLKLRSNGKHSRDYVYIDDIVDAYVSLAENVRLQKIIGAAFNFGTREPLSVQQVLQQIEKATGKPVLHTIEDTAKYEIQAQYLDSSKAKKILGWQPKVSRTDGFKRTAAWYADFFKPNS